MHVGVVTLDPSLLLIVGIGGSAWLVLKFLVLPRYELQDLRSRGSDVIRTGTRLRMWQGLRTLAASVTLAPTGVALMYILAQARIEAGAADPTKVRSIVATRDLLERTLGQFTGVAAGTWIAALLILGVIWLVARNSASRRRWMQALEARRSSHLASLAGESTESLLNAAQAADAARFQELQARSQRISEENRTRIAALEQAPVLRLPGSKGEIEASVALLRTTIAHFEQEAEQLEHAQHGEPEAMTGMSQYAQHQGSSEEG